MLLCTVRDCHKPLRREHRRLVCAAGHSFDVARSGYINLLQPQDRRSKNPGDTLEAVAARRRLHDRGVTEGLLAGMRALLEPAAEDGMLDAGCGEGFYLGSLAGSLAAPTGQACGVDISTGAIDLAARRYPGCEWVVANADRFVPYADGSFACVLSITGRMNPAEFARVLREGGRLLVAVPAPDDLIELRGAGRDRAERTIEMFRGQFRLDRHERVTTRAALDEDGLRDVLVSIYRPLTRLESRPEQVTFSLDLLMLQKEISL